MCPCNISGISANIVTTALRMASIWAEMSALGLRRRNPALEWGESDRQGYQSHLLASVHIPWYSRSPGLENLPWNLTHLGKWHLSEENLI